MYAGIGEGLGKVDGGLAPELAYGSNGALVLDDPQDVVFRDGFEIEGVAGVEVGAYGFRVVVDDHRSIAHLLQSPHAVHA